MAKVTKFAAEVTKPIGRIDLYSEGNSSIKIWCYSEDKVFCFNFGTFFGCDNRDELFDRGKGNSNGFGKLGDSDWNYPFGWISYEDLGDDLSTYELALCNESSRKWIFLSMSNCVELYSDELPTVTVFENERKLWNPENLGLGKNSLSYIGTANIEIDCPEFLSSLDEQMFFASLDSMSFSAPQGISRRIKIELAKTGDFDYLRDVLGLFVRYKISMAPLKEIVFSGNRKIFFDSEKYWYSETKEIE